MMLESFVVLIIVIEITITIMLDFGRSKLDTLFIGKMNLVWARGLVVKTPPLHYL